MQALNSVVIEGNLTKDPVNRETPKGNPVTVFNIASNRYRGTGTERVEEVSFFEVEAWNGLALACSKYLAKGRGVRVAGRLKQDRWNTPDGDPRSRIKVIASDVEFKPQIAKAKETEVDSLVAENPTVEGTDEVSDELDEGLDDRTREEVGEELEEAVI